MAPPDRDRLRTARLQLLFTPALVHPGHDPLEVLGAALPFVDVVQVRIKDEEHPDGPSPARELAEWTRRVLALVADLPAARPAVLVNDRVDVARALFEEGCAGVHVGQDDLPPAHARRVLGPDAWIGLSTHDARQVAAAQFEPVDYLGFGPIFATETKGYSRGLGPEAAWIASTASALPVFPIGGIDRSNIDDLHRAGRAAVSRAILAADDPAAVARELMNSLCR